MGFDIASAAARPIDFSASNRVRYVHFILFYFFPSRRACMRFLGSALPRQAPHAASAFSRNSTQTVSPAGTVSAANT